MAGGFVSTVEGKTTLLVPESSLAVKVPPKTPAFFNPAAKLNRDISILAYHAYAPSLSSKTFADSLAGVGARALRVANEVPEMEEVYCNDINAMAIEAAREAAQINHISSKCAFSVNEVCRFLSQGTRKGERFGIVDLDPFGTPAKHIDCVLRGVLDGGMVSITATDTAVLCGVYPEVCHRRYYGMPLNNNYANEIAIRLLTSLLALTASRLELAIRPIFVHSMMHYLRVYASIEVSSSRANDVYENIGFVLHCFVCGNRFNVKELDGKGKCQLCGSSTRAGGHLWTGPLHDVAFVKKMLEQQPANQCKKVLDAAADEISDIPYYFRADEISARMKTNPSPVLEIIGKLKSSGYAASRTALNPASFKTNARIDQIVEILK